MGYSVALEARTQRVWTNYDRMDMSLLQSCVCVEEVLNAVGDLFCLFLTQWD